MFGLGTLTWWMFGIALLATLTMSMLHSTVGFAFGLLSTPVFLLMFRSKEVVILTIILTLALNVLIVSSSFASVSAQELRRLSPWVVLGLPVGLWILSAVNVGLLKVIVGTIIIVFVVPMLLGRRRNAEWLGRMPAVAGFAGGVLTTSINFNGPPAVLYLEGRGLTAETRRATVAAYLMFAHALALALLAAVGFVTLHVIEVAAALLPACVVGYLCGIRLRPQMEDEAFSRLVLGLVVIMGVLAVVS